MINTIADLIREFLITEERALSSQNIKQKTAIGNRYEGLTAVALNKGIFVGLDLKFTTRSFVQSQDGGISDEFDIILSVGDGIPVTYSPGQFIFSPKQVVAIFQIKKNLFAADIKDSYLNLKNAVEIFSSIIKLERFQEELLDDSFLSICKKNTDGQSQTHYDNNETYIYDSLKIQAALPIRIVIGFNGFKSKSNFRKSYIKYLKDSIENRLNNSVEGYAPHELPDLIICKDYSIFKNNGMPFAAPLSDGNWPLLASSKQNPMLLILEYVWTRLSYMFDISSDIFGEDLSNENGAILLSCKNLIVEGGSKWQYFISEMEEDELNSEPFQIDWQPVFLEKHHADVISHLCSFEEIDLMANGWFREFRRNNNISLPLFIDGLSKTGLVNKDENKLKLLTKKCKVTHLKDGRFAAAENNSGRFDRWLKKNDVDITSE